MLSKFHIFACARTSDTETLERDLFRSPAIAEKMIPRTILWNRKSASSAFAGALEEATAEFLIFTHCDVYFPKRWFERLGWELDRLARIDPDWAVAGISSMTSSGELVGRIWDASLEPISRGLFGKPLTTPVPILSTDEMAFVVRRGANISFDPLLPNFHLYGTDIILSAERAGKRSYGLDMPLIHNAKAQLNIGRDYVTSYKYMVQKWRSRLPVPTPCGPITSNTITPLLRRLRVRYKARFRPSTYSTQRASDPSVKAVELGLDRILSAPLCK
jgi:hypothetical protein